MGRDIDTYLSDSVPKWESTPFPFVTCRISADRFEITRISDALRAYLPGPLIESCRFMDEYAAELLSRNSYRRFCLEQTGFIHSLTSGFDNTYYVNNKFEFPFNRVRIRAYPQTAPDSASLVCFLFLGELFDAKKDPLTNVLTYRVCDFVMKQESDTETCVVYSRKKNWLDLPDGISAFSYAEYARLIQTRGNITGILEGKRVFSCAEGDRIIKDEYNVTYIVSIDGATRYKRCDTFRLPGDSANLYNIIYDVTSVILREQEINSKLKAAVQDAANANQLKARFLSCLSHDMRTPLSALVGLTDIAMKSDPNDVVESLLGKIRSCSTYTLSMINNLLDVEKLESNHMELSPAALNIEALAAQVFDIARTRAAEKNIHFTCEKDIAPGSELIIGDEIRLKQIFLNLLTNAVKYTPSDGSVRWVIRTSVENGAVSMSSVISDNGIGMSESFQEQMYDAFRREVSERQDSESNGSGLGLMIVRNLIDLMNGTISCVSAVNQGTSFTVRVNFELPSESEINEVSRDTRSNGDIAALRGRKVLLCEDSELNAEILIYMLEEFGLLVDYAENGLTGLEKCSRDVYFAVLTDLRMPCMNGFELATRLRETKPEIPVVLITADRTSPEPDAYAVFSDVLYKPVDSKALANTLLKLL